MRTYGLNSIRLIWFEKVILCQQMRLLFSFLSLIFQKNLFHMNIFFNDLGLTFIEELKFMRV